MQARDGNDQSVPSIDKAAGPARVTYRLIADPRLSAFVFCVLVAGLFAFGASGLGPTAEGEFQRWSWFMQDQTAMDIQR